MAKPLRICILGNTGSGKSTLADELGRALQLPVYHLDRELLYGQFERYPEEKQIALQDAIIRQDGWIIDGNYRKYLPDRLKRATLVVFLNVSRLRAIPRTFARYIRQNNVKKSIPEGANDRVSWTLFTWGLKWSRRKRLRELREAAKDSARIEILVLNSGKVSQWVEAIKAHLS